MIYTGMLLLFAPKIAQGEGEDEGALIFLSTPLPDPFLEGEGTSITYLSARF